MTHNEIILTGVFAQLYSRLVMAAVQHIHVYYSDLAPVVFGVQFTRTSPAQHIALQELVLETLRLDLKHNRPPVAALYVSRAGDTKLPMKSFFAEYTNITGQLLDEDSWQDLVEQVWRHYAPDLKGLS